MQAEVRAVVEHVLADRPGDWRVLITGSQANDRWELKITGPQAFERSYTLEGSAGRASTGGDPAYLGEDAPKTDRKELVSTKRNIRIFTRSRSGTIRNPCF